MNRSVFCLTNYSSVLGVLRALRGEYSFRITTLLLFVVSVGCAEQPQPTPPAAATVTDSAALDSTLVARGRFVYDSTCAECHTLEAPPKTAPPLGEIARRYHQVFTDGEEAIEHLVDYTRSPAPAKSRLAQPAIDDWGVMPGLDLPDQDLRAVGRYIWDLVTPRPRGE